LSFSILEIKARTHPNNKRIKPAMRKAVSVEIGQPFYDICCQEETFFILFFKICQVILCYFLNEISKINYLLLDE